MSAFIPKVSEADLERLIARDFPSEHHETIRDTISRLEVREKNRVVAACLKNANGNIERLNQDLADASGYWRELISEAEYPKVKKARNLSKEQIREKQREQYLAWFSKK